MVNITAESLRIDAASLAGRIEAFIADSFAGMNRSGIVVPMSGGLDSSVVASLCVNAAGKDHVTGLMLPEKQGNPDADRYARLMAEKLGIATEKIDISQILKALGTYAYALSYVPTRPLKETMVKKFVISSSGENNYVKAMKGNGDRLIRRGLASFFAKQRIRLAVTYKYAEENNLLVVGSAHKSEDLTGLFVKFGVDDVADLMPLKYLYRTHILQLAETLDIPSVIIGRTPNPDLIPGISDKYRDVLDLSAEEVDLVLFGIERGASSRAISEQTGIDDAHVSLIRELYVATDHMRHPSMAPDVTDIIR